MGRILNKAHELRQKGDYYTHAEFEMEDVEKPFEEAAYSLAQIRQAVSLIGK